MRMSGGDAVTAPPGASKLQRGRPEQGCPGAAAERENAPPPNARRSPTQRLSGAAGAGRAAAGGPGPGPVSTVLPALGGRNGNGGGGAAAGPSRSFMAAPPLAPLPVPRQVRNWVVNSKIGSGSFGVIHGATHQHSGVRVAIKFEPMDAVHPQLMVEAKVLKALRGVHGIPHVYWYGSCERFFVMVLERLGPSLEDVFTACGRRFSVATTALVGLQMVRRLRRVHEHDFLHRDVKPDNFLLGPPGSSRENVIYAIDFGLAKRYRDKLCRHIPYREGKSLTGTARYVSITTHLGIEQSRRDDIEGLAYVLLYFLRGSLPWQGLRALGKKDKYQKIMRTKVLSDPARLCRGLPKQFMQFLVYAQGLNFETEPNYSLLSSLLQNAAWPDPMTVPADCQFDWMGKLRPPAGGAAGGPKARADVKMCADAKAVVAGAAGNLAVGPGGNAGAAAPGAAGFAAASSSADVPAPTRQRVHGSPPAREPRASPSHRPLPPEDGAQCTDEDDRGDEEEPAQGPTLRGRRGAPPGRLPSAAVVSAARGPRDQPLRHSASTSRLPVLELGGPSAFLHNPMMVMHEARTEDESGRNADPSNARHAPKAADAGGAAIGDGGPTTMYAGGNSAADAGGRAAAAAGGRIAADGTAGGRVAANAGGRHGVNVSAMPAGGAAAGNAGGRAGGNAGGGAVAARPCGGGDCSARDRTARDHRAARGCSPRERTSREFSGGGRRAGKIDAVPPDVAAGGAGAAAGSAAHCGVAAPAGAARGQTGSGEAGRSGCSGAPNLAGGGGSAFPKFERSEAATRTRPQRTAGGVAAPPAAREGAAAPAPTARGRMGDPGPQVAAALPPPTSLMRGTRGGRQAGMVRSAAPTGGGQFSNGAEKTFMAKAVDDDAGGDAGGGGGAAAACAQSGGGAAADAAVAAAAVSVVGSLASVPAGSAAPVAAASGGGGVGGGVGGVGSNRRLRACDFAATAAGDENDDDLWRLSQQARYRSTASFNRVVLLPTAGGPGGVPGTESVRPQAPLRKAPDVAGAAEAVAAVATAGAARAAARGASRAAAAAGAASGPAAASLGEERKSARVLRSRGGIREVPGGAGGSRHAGAAPPPAAVAVSGPAGAPAAGGGGGVGDPGGTFAPASAGPLTSRAAPRGKADSTSSSRFRLVKGSVKESGRRAPTVPPPAVPPPTPLPAVPPV